jgi:hypothetical protein
MRLRALLADYPRLIDILERGIILWGGLLALFTLTALKSCKPKNNPPSAH